ncbi:LANO_0H17942g1_1 [Lachancea nothofagi CBS 11611]|uniref:LANO_0H17942g1_1 n=1 Tax=Lachancea nothofagi CBS 11611 TaxID=1266666 RepID=A0A1G4KN24_9SACH|nr:LANO_0H17942g1_1 [Lachancea nothofagi CBS 11611]
MQCSAYNLPKEVWLVVFEYLEYDDLLRLRTCSHKFNDLVKIQWVWGARCHKRWLQVEDEDFLASQLTNGTRGCSKDDWFYYYRYRNRVDKHTFNTLCLIAACKQIGSYKNRLENLLKYGALIVPLLRDLELRGYSNNLPFDVTFLARQLLLTMRHKSLFAFIESSIASKANQWVHYAEESVFLPLAAMDLAFNRILPHRAKIIQQVHSMVKHDFQDLSEFMQLPSTLRLDKIMKYLFQALNGARQEHLRQATRYYLDDFMLLRVYAGEARGHSIVLLAIIQAVSSHYNVETVLCEEFLIVRDSRIRSGETYVTISVAGAPRIFTRKNLVDSMCRVFPDRQVVLNSIIPKMLQPLRTHDLMFKIFDEWSPHCKKSYWNVVSEKSIKNLEALMPHSRFPVRVSDYEYFQAFWKLKIASIQRQFRNLGGAHFLQFVELQYPHDTILIGSALNRPHQDGDSNFLGGPQNFKPLYEKYSLSKSPSPLLGRIVCDRRIATKYIVLAAKIAENGSHYLNLLDPFGDVHVLLREDVEVADGQILSPQDVQHLVHLLSLSDLGLFFSKFDTQSNAFQPSQMFATYLADKNEEN